MLEPPVGTSLKEAKSGDLDVERCLTARAEPGGTDLTILEGCIPSIHSSSTSSSVRYLDRYQDKRRLARASMFLVACLTLLHIVGLAELEVSQLPLLPPTCPHPWGWKVVGMASLKLKK